MTSNTEKKQKFLEQFDATNLGIDKNENVYLIVQQKKAKVAYPLMSKAARIQLRKMAKSFKLTLTKKGMEEFVEVLEAKAFEYDERPITVQVRYALTTDNRVIIDLGDGELIELSAGKVRLIEGPNEVNEIFFSRPEFQQVMVHPKLTMSKEDITAVLKRLHLFLNTNINTFYLLIGYLTYLVAHPKVKGVPYPILFIQGEKGAGKSFFCNQVLRGLIDPNAVSGIHLTRQMDDYAAILNSMFLVIFDNLRTLTKAQSDLLCTTATKGTQVKRELYTTASLMLQDLHSPLALNAIHDCVQESDLASRCLHVKLNAMPEKARRPEQELQAELSELMPDAFGAILWLAAQALDKLSCAEVTHKARMMDFAKWIGALELVLGVEPGKLQLVYKNNVKSLMASGMADDSLTIALQKLVNDLKAGEAWKSTPSGLLTQLHEYESPMYLPKGAAALTAKLKGQESSLNANGIYIQFGRASERYVLVSGKPF
ncbi:ATP-binding protein [Vibrio sp. PNB22_3_1]